MLRGQSSDVLLCSVVRTYAVAILLIKGASALVWKCSYALWKKLQVLFLRYNTMSFWRRDCRNQILISRPLLCRQAWSCIAI